MNRAEFSRPNYHWKSFQEGDVYLCTHGYFMLSLNLDGKDWNYKIGFWVDGDYRTLIEGKDSALFRAIGRCEGGYEVARQLMEKSLGQWAV